MKEKALTVAELIEKLREMPQDARVKSEGCDCIGEVADAELNEDEQQWVLLTRPPRRK